MLAELGWSEAMYITRTSEMTNWLWSPLPAEKGDVLAYTGYLSLKGCFPAESLVQCISAF